MKIKTLIVTAAAVLAAVSCGPVKTASDSVNVSLPDQAAADSIAAAVAGASSAVVPLNTAAGPRIFCFAPAADTNLVRVRTLAPEKGSWKEENSADYDCLDDNGMKFVSLTGAPQVLTFTSGQFVGLDLLRESGSRAQRATLLYGPATGSMQALTFTGKYLSDGRLEGESNKNFLINTENPEVQWAVSRQDADSTLVVLSEADLLTDQAIEWWLEHNPKVFTGASKVLYGALPADCSLVADFKASRSREVSDKYRALLYDKRGYTVIVAQRRSTGEYFLAWAEPVCVNKVRDRLLNTIYFENETGLALFYYKGNKTFKYHLNLSSTKLTR